MSTHLIVLGFIVLATFGAQYEPRSSPSPSFVHLLVSILFSNISAYELYMFLICALRNICTYVTNHNCTLIKYHILYTCKCTLIKYIFYQCVFAGLLRKCKYRSLRLHLTFAHQVEDFPCLLPVIYITVWKNDNVFFLPIPTLLPISFYSQTRRVNTVCTKPVLLVTHNRQRAPSGTILSLR